MPKPAAPGRDFAWLALIVLVGLAIRFAAIAFLPHTPESDELAYQSMAINLLHGRGIVDHMGNFAMYNMAYPSFILAPAYWLGGEGMLPAQTMNALLGGLSIVLCYGVAQAAGARRSGSLLAALAWAVYLPASVYGVYLAKENLMIPLMLGLMWCALKLLQAPSLRLLLATGALLGAIALTGNAALSLVGALFVAFLLQPARPLQKLGSAAIVFVAALLVVAPCLARNDARIGQPVLNTNGGFNLYLGNNPNATGWFVSIGDTPRGPSWGELRQQGEVQASEVLKQEAIGWIKENPARFVSLALHKAVYFWTPPLHASAAPMSFAERMVRWVWALEFVALAVLALAGLASRRGRTRPMLILWLALLGYTAAHMVFYVIFRYREPVMPILCILAALAVDRWLDRGAQPPMRRA